MGMNDLVFEVIRWVLEEMLYFGSIVLEKVNQTKYFELTESIQVVKTL